MQYPVYCPRSTTEYILPYLNFQVHLPGEVTLEEGPFSSYLFYNGLVHQFGPHPPTQPIVDHLTLRLPQHPTSNGSFR